MSLTCNYMQSSMLILLCALLPSADAYGTVLSASNAAWQDLGGLCLFEDAGFGNYYGTEWSADNRTACLTLCLEKHAVDLNAVSWQPAAKECMCQGVCACIEVSEDEPWEVALPSGCTPAPVACLDVNDNTVPQDPWNPCQVPTTTSPPSTSPTSTSQMTSNQSTSTAAPQNDEASSAKVLGGPDKVILLLFLVAPLWNGR